MTNATFVLHTKFADQRPTELSDGYPEARKLLALAESKHDRVSFRKGNAPVLQTRDGQTIATLEDIPGFRP